MSKRHKFLQDAKTAPSRFYRHPADVIRDRRLSNEDRLEILDAWEREVRQRMAAEEADRQRVEELHRLRVQVEHAGRASDAQE